MTDTAATADTGETLTHTLIVPITVDGKQVKHLTLREPDVSGMLAAAVVGGGDAAREMAAQHAVACDLPFPDFLKIKARDMSAIMKLCQRWFGAGNGSGSGN
ncbi:MAG: hypothetical protein C0457_06385 [Polymorphum sp.]|nr:hypothetical protein [Polymorphum sp.]